MLRPYQQGKFIPLLLSATNFSLGALWAPRNLPALPKASVSPRKVTAQALWNAIPRGKFCIEREGFQKHFRASICFKSPEVVFEDATEG